MLHRVRCLQYYSLLMPTVSSWSCELEGHLTPLDNVNQVPQLMHRNPYLPLKTVKQAMLKILGLCSIYPWQDNSTKEFVISLIDKYKCSLYLRFSNKRRYKFLVTFVEKIIKRDGLGASDTGYVYFRRKFEKM